MSPRSKHPCPCSGCGILIASQHFMCARHWGMVPVELKLLLNDLERCEDKERAQPLIARALDLARSAVSAREGLCQSVRELREEAQSFV